MVLFHYPLTPRQSGGPVRPSTAAPHPRDQGHSPSQFNLWHKRSPGFHGELTGAIELPEETDRRTMTTRSVHPDPTPDLSYSGAGQTLRVCVASPLFPPDYGGAALRFQRYAPGLRARGVEMSVIAAEVGAWRRGGGYPEWSDKASEWKQPSGEIQVQRIPIPELPLRGRALARRQKRIFEKGVLARCRQDSTPPDVLIWLQSPSVGALPTLVRLRREGIPMICAETMYDGSSVPRWRQWLDRVYRPLPYRLMDSLIVGTRAMRDSLQDFGVHNRVEIIPHGVDLKRFRPARDPEELAAHKARLGLPRDSEAILFVGPITPRKGVLLLAQAWNRVSRARPKAHLILVGPEQGGGDARDSFAARVRQEVDRGPGASRVQFVGPVGDVENYLRAADLFVFPSEREGMPNAVCEAFATGLPSLLTPFLGLSDELGRPGTEYLLVERTPAGIAEGMLSVLADDERRRSLGIAARRWMEDHLDVERSLDRLALLCNQVATSTPSEHPT